MTTLSHTEVAEFLTDTQSVHNVTGAGAYGGCVTKMDVTCKPPEPQAPAIENTNTGPAILSNHLG